MTYPQFLAVTVYFGTPLVIVWRWVVVGLRLGRAMVWSMLAALLLWLIQAGVLISVIVLCIGGHGCNPPPVPEAVVYGLIAGAYIGIIGLLLLSVGWHRR